MFQPNQTHQGPQNVVLRNGAQQLEHPKFQASVIEKWTEQFFRSAGIYRGMNVLDLGCGMGDVSLLAARLVGPAGSVTGIDRDAVMVERARERVRHHECRADIRFISTDLLDFEATHQFDAVIGRYFLLYQPDPVAALLHASKQVRSGGLVVFHEMNFANPIRSYPDGTLFGTMYSLVAETFRRAGCYTDLGLHLTRLFLRAGLPCPVIKAEAPVGGKPSSFVCTWLTEILRSLLPRIEQFGLARVDELERETLVTRMDRQATARHAQLIGPLQFGIWTRIPAQRPTTPLASREFEVLS